MDLNIDIMDLSVDEIKDLLGKRVVCTKGEIGGLLIDCQKNPQAGEIVGYYNGDINIEFDNYIGGNSSEWRRECTYRDIKDGHGWFISSHFLKSEFKDDYKYNIIFEENINLELSDKQSLNSLFL